ncbi:hypothetical protein [Lentzea sp. NPDC003310]|uniref:hypothetical protein n=1 Tax=Lentzea sp. NPDC003310 TaxID=3154447 RepID=UPI0033A0A0F0
MTRRSPQEKKALSYAKDRRNTYGKNDKSSRKNIPKNKRKSIRSNRRRAHLVLTQVEPDGIESELKRERPHVWRKCPDSPLGEVVAAKLERRARLADLGKRPKDMLSG